MSGYKTLPGCIGSGRPGLKPPQTFCGSRRQQQHRGTAVPKCPVPLDMQLLLCHCVQHQHAPAMQWPCGREGWRSGRSQPPQIIFSPTAYGRMLKVFPPDSTPCRCSFHSLGNRNIMYSSTNLLRARCFKICWLFKLLQEKSCPEAIGVTIRIIV